MATLRAGVRIGEEIAAFGYPLLDTLSTGGNFTVGNVSALAGLKTIADTSRYRRRFNRATAADRSSISVAMS